MLKSPEMSACTATDLVHLERAVDLAERGLGRAHPNPIVGAVIVRDDEVLGEGWHEAFGEAHAELNAIAACGGADLGGSTLYVSLEPCCHEGKTPPCTDAILAAGIGRVVVGSDDPTAKAAGRGLGILRDEGVEVVVADGAIAQRARRLNQAFRKHARTGRPWVLFKSAMTLDGKVATRAGDSKWISGEQSRATAHALRARVDAVAIGIGTALADDPQLTARIPGVERQPRRVVFDSLARLPSSSRLVADTGQVPVTLVVSRAAPRRELDALEHAGVQVLTAVGENEPARVRSALEQLGAQGVTSILLEGGPRLAGAFLDAGEIDELRLFIAPLILGGRTARDPIEGEGPEQISAALRAIRMEYEGSGEDVMISAVLREW